MILASKFDVLRGWPKEGALDETFPIHAAVTVEPGNIVYVETAGTIQLATTPNRTTTDAVSTWVVVEGNDDYSGEYVGKAVCLRANALIRFEYANITAGTYAVGTKVSFTSGILKEAAITEQVIGEVVTAYDAANGYVDVYYSGGSGAKLT